MTDRARRPTSSRTTTTQEDPSGDHAPDAAARQVQDPTPRFGDHLARARAVAARLPLYQRIADDLRTRIESGELAAGTELPSEADMVAQYNVSQKTVRAAVAVLRASGLITTEQGRRTKVRSTVGFSSGDILRFDPQITRDGDEWRTWDSQDWTLVHAPSTYRDSAAQYAIPLAVPPAADVLVAQRQLAHDSGVHAIQRVFIPLEVAANNVPDNPFQPPADLYRLFTAAGHDLHWQETTAATMPSPDDAASLQIPDGVPLLIHLRITLTADGIPLALEETRLPADRATITATRSTPVAP